MAKMTDTAAQASIGAATRDLHLPTVRAECVCWRSSNLAVDDHANARSVIIEIRG